MSAGDQSRSYSSALAMNARALVQAATDIKGVDKAIAKIMSAKTPEAFTAVFELAVDLAALKAARARSKDPSYAAYVDKEIAKLEKRLGK